MDIGDPPRAVLIDLSEATGSACSVERRAAGLRLDKQSSHNSSASQPARQAVARSSQRGGATLKQEVYR